MDISAIGTGLDPFAPAQGPSSEIVETPAAEAPEPVSLPEGLGTQIDTSA